MSAKDMTLSVCREQPSCGSPVLDARKHRAWHRAVVLADPRSPAVVRPRYVGMDDAADDSQADGARRDDDLDVTARHHPGG